MAIIRFSHFSLPGLRPTLPYIVACASIYKAMAIAETLNIIEIGFSGLFGFEKLQKCFCSRSYSCIKCNQIYVATSAIF